jgi:murein L,D-transpeptidase YcbB/YkuD
MNQWAQSRLYLFLLILTVFFCFALSVSVAASDEARITSQIDTFYKERNGDPVWLNGKALNKNGRILIQTLEQSWKEGLNPESYGLSTLKEQIDSLDFMDATALEISLTKAFIRYVQDMSGMRVKSKNLGMDSKGWRIRKTEIQALLDLKAHETDLKKYIINLEPQGSTYQKIKEELVRLVETKESEENNRKPIEIEGLLKPGRGSDAVPALREKLGLYPKEGNERYVYDTELQKAVEVFQTENGLKPDGISGQNT